jgi:3-oxoacyl-[acyl-carrier protein] reductase
MGGGAYCTVKAGLMGLTRAMAIQYGPQGIRTNYLAPHVVRTDMTDAIWDSDWFQRLNQEMTPMDRDATVEDVANTVAFLLDEGSYFNGQTLAMDGGWTTTKYLAPEAHFAQRVPLGS